MESSRLSPSSMANRRNNAEEWKSLKRAPERYSESDENSLGSDGEDFILENRPSKRHKCLDNSYLEDVYFESPVILRPKRNFQNKERFQEVNQAILSPITEISVNLNETSLCGGNSLQDSSCTTADCGYDEGTTPVRRKGSLLRANVFKRSQSYKEDGKIISTKDQYWHSDANGDVVDNDKLSDEIESSNNLDPSFQVQRSTRKPSSNRLNFDASLSDMGMEELSFYNDDHVSQNRHYTASPPNTGLLSPEGSPQHFQVVEKPKFLQTRKNSFPLSDKNIIAQNVTNHSTARSTKTPSKGYRILQSMSSNGSMESTMNEEYMGCFNLENLKQLDQSTALNFPSDLSSLFTRHIIKNSPIKTPEMRRPKVRRCLSMAENTQLLQPKTPESVNACNSNAANNTPFSSRLNGNCCFKRPESPSTTCSPRQTKRYRIDEKENLDDSFISSKITGKTSPAPNSPACLALAGTRKNSTITRPILRKSMSMNDAQIMSALNRSENKDGPDLIGDFSKPYVLPLIEGRHCDLKSITSETVARLLKGDFDDEVANFKIIDCRYPYEFEGGHITGAKNLYTQEQIIEEFLTNEKTEQEQTRNEESGSKRNIIIFHCEFSSERGPKLSRFLRNFDRERNTNSYPALDYPEIYLLHNGYKEFFETHIEHCTPHAYRPMLEPSYNEEYRHFRAKIKSWNGDGLGGATQRVKKSRSRLML